MKQCKFCLKTKALDEFHKHQTNKDRKMGHCKTCDHVKKQKYKERNYRKTRDIEHDCHLRRTYNITLIKYNEMLDQQDNKCAICGVHKDTLTRGLYVDHCHATGKVRELLCTRCNSVIGYCKENSNNLLNAINYLLKHKKP